jgi:hypothetical protein
VAGTRVITPAGMFGSVALAAEFYGITASGSELDLF